MSLSSFPAATSIFILLIFLSSSLFSLCLASYHSEHEDDTPFTYDDATGKGPKEWGKIHPESWKLCENGKLQSPIDLQDQNVEAAPSIGKLKRNYKPAPATVFNRGHDITVNWKGDAGKININGTDYKLKHCHWHSPAEHTFNGTRYDLELHAVHKNEHGEIAVIGIVYKYGRPDRFLSKLLPQIKLVARNEERDVGILNPGYIKFGSRKYYRYVGSLSVPPCSEGVIWTVVRKVRTVSREQVRALQKAVDEGFEANARPTQECNGRTVMLYTPTRLN